MFIQKGGVLRTLEGGKLKMSLNFGVRISLRKMIAIGIEVWTALDKIGTVWKSLLQRDLKVKTGLWKHALD